MGEDEQARILAEKAARPCEINGDRRITRGLEQHNTAVQRSECAEAECLSIFQTQISSRSPA